MHKSLALILASMLLAATAGGCVMEEDYDEDIGSDQQAIWSIGSDVQTVEWDSGIVLNLSGPESVTCAATYGSNYLLTRLRGWKQPVGVVGQYIARLKTRCTEYNWVPLSNFMQQDTSSHQYDLLYSTSYGSSYDGITAIDVAQYAPIGLRLALDSRGGDFVEDVALLHGHFATTASGVDYIDNYSSPHQEEWAMGFAGSDTYDLVCPAQYVAAGIQVKYDVGDGKLRYVKLFCRDALSY